MGVDIEDFLQDFSIKCDDILKLMRAHNINARYMSSKICFGSNKQRMEYLKRMNMWEKSDTINITKGNIMLEKFNLSINELINNQIPDDKYILFLKEMIR